MAEKSRTLLLASDLDHTMVQNEDLTHQRLLAFNHAWLANGTANTGQKLLVFSTGRSPELFKQLWTEAPLITPDVLICSVGSEIFYNAASPVLRTLLASSRQQVASLGLSSPSTPTQAPLGTPQGPEFLPDGSWEAFLDEGWDRSKAQALVEEHFPQLKPQVASEQRSHKISYSLDPGALPGGKAEAAQLMVQLQKVLKEDHGINAKVIYSGGRDVDVLSEAAGKGRGLSFLLQRLKEAGFEPANVQVAGDSGNDIELFQVPGVKGCVVSNAHPELRAFADAQVAKGDAAHICQATEPCAGGILQAMQHFGLLQLPQPSSPPCSLHPFPATATSHQLLSHEGPGGHLPGAPAPADTAALKQPTATALQNAASVPIDGLSSQVASHQAAQWLLLSGDVGAREFAWRLGIGLAQALREGIAAPDDLVNHSALRLMVANDCSLVLHPPNPSQGKHGTHSIAPGAGVHASGVYAPSSGAKASKVSVREVQQDLEPVAVVAASDQCSTCRAWIDELSVVQLSQDASSNAGVAAGEEGALQQEALAVSADGALTRDGAALPPRMGAWKLCFKAYCLSQPAGTRDESVHEVEAIVHQQAQPVPHGFLAKSIRAWGPFELSTVMPHIHSAKMH